MKLYFFARKCEHCDLSVPLRERLRLLKYGYISCQHCNSKLTYSIFFSVLCVITAGVPIGVFIYFICVNYFQLNEMVSNVVGFSVAMMFPRLFSPLADLVEVNIANKEK